LAVYADDEIEFSVNNGALEKYKKSRQSQGAQSVEYDTFESTVQLAVSQEANARRSWHGGARRGVANSDLDASLQQKVHDAFEGGIVERIAIRMDEKYVL